MKLENTMNKRKDWNRKMNKLLDYILIPYHFLVAIILVISVLICDREEV